MQPSFLGRVSGPTFLAALFLAACSGTSTSSGDPADAASPAAPATGRSDSGVDVGDAGKKDARAPEPKAGPVEVLNLSYVNDPATLSTEVTFVLRNNADRSIEKVRSVKLLFGGTEVVTWGELGVCSEWTVFSQRTSPVLTMSVGTFDTDDYDTTAVVTCSGGSTSTARGRRPRVTRSAIGNGAVTVVVNGVLGDATAFVAQAEAPAP